MSRDETHQDQKPAAAAPHQQQEQHHHHHQGAVPVGMDYSADAPDADIAAMKHKHASGTATAADVRGVEKGDGLKTPPDYEKVEAGVMSTGRGSGSSREEINSFSYRVKHLYRRHRWAAHIFYFLLFTGWWIASLVLHRHDKNWVVPFLVWLCITLRLVTYYLPARHLSNAIRWLWQHSALVVYERIPRAYRTPLGAIVALAAILVGSFVSEEAADNTRANRAVSLFGMLVMIGVFYVTSKHRSRVNWRTVIVGMLSQYIIGLFVLRTGVGYDIFKFIADRAGDLLSFARQGVAFLTTPDISNLKFFFFSVIPAIIFFISLVQVLYYIGFIQWFIKKVATFVFWALGVSGAEAVVAAATPFIGQGESAMLVRPFVPHMTKAEIHQILTCGFATISGSVLVGYIQLGLNAEVLVSSCIMSIPASLAISKLRYPETEETLTAGRVVIPEDEDNKAENALHAFANGAWLGIKIGGTIVASLLCIIAAVGLVNALLTWWGRYLNINDPTLTLQTILGYVLYPVAFLLGVPRDSNDILLVARLISQKVITVRHLTKQYQIPPVPLRLTDLIVRLLVQNEYNAFTDLTTDKTYANLSPRSRLIATYALCGFGNIGSLGVQIGILGQLAPTRGGDVSKLALSALISGVTATLTSAAVAGLVITDQFANFSSPSKTS